MNKKQSLEKIWEESKAYVKTIIDIAHEPFLILDKELAVIAANESYYKTFEAKPSEVEGKSVFKIGKGQWNIEGLKKHLEEVLPKDDFFKGFEVKDDFPKIGRRTMILNARRIYRKSNTKEDFPPMILFAMDDITEMLAVSEKLSNHLTAFEKEMSDRTKLIEKRLDELRKGPL